MFITPIAFLITLISSVFWGTFDGLRKHLIAKLNHWTLLFYLSLFFSISFLTWILITKDFQFNNSYLIYGSLTVVFNFLANYYYIRAIEISYISSVVPFLAFTSLFTALSGFIVLGETLSPLQILGIILVVVSSFFINYRKGVAVISSLTKNKGALLMILVSLLWALSAPFDKLAVEHSNTITHSFIQSTFITLLNLIMVIKFSKQRLIPDFFIAPRALISASIIAATALGLQFYAYTLMPVQFLNL